MRACSEHTLRRIRRRGEMGQKVAARTVGRGGPIDLRGELVEWLDLLEHHLAPKQIERLHASRCGTAGTLQGAVPCHACSGRHPPTEAALRLRCVPWHAWMPVVPSHTGAMRASRTICSILFCLMYPCPPQICIQPRALVNCARACTPAGRCSGLQRHIGQRRARRSRLL